MYTSCCQELAAPGNPARIPALKFTTESWLGLRAPRSAPSSFPLCRQGRHTSRRGEGFAFLETLRQPGRGSPPRSPTSLSAESRPAQAVRSSYRGDWCITQAPKMDLILWLMEGAARPANPERPFRHENLQFQSFPETPSPPPSPTPPEAPRSPRHCSIAFLPIQSPEVHF